MEWLPSLLLIRTIYLLNSNTQKAANPGGFFVSNACEVYGVSKVLNCAEECFSTSS